ncbi:MAG: hypothetical protein FJ246_09780 [Nitrospira sp.]|nr:hypothetical protein [Nitrospira sp.]
MDNEHGTEQNRTEGPYEEGKRAGAHPLIVVLGTIGGLWLLIVLFMPDPKHKPTAVPADVQNTMADDPDTAPVMFQITATLLDLNILCLSVPPQATESQVAGLLKRFREARLANTLTTLLPSTTPEHKLGEHAVADIYVFSDQHYARPDVVRVLARGAHAPGELYPQAIPFEVAMEQVRGHYRIDLSDSGAPDNGSIGFADESGIHSKSYRRLF